MSQNDFNQQSADSQQPAEAIKQMMMSEYERKKKLADYVRFSCAKGWVVESQNDFNAVLFGGQKCNHTLHACITFIGGFLTCGVGLLWGIVWIILACTQKQERLILNIDEFGEIITQKVSVS